MSEPSSRPHQQDVPQSRRHWQLKSQSVNLGRPLLMGIVNVTPDSFSDGGKFFDPQSAIDHGLQLAGEGADFLDVGGESTRPYSTPVDVSEELRRVIPVIRELARQTDIPISVDTWKAQVAREAVQAGAEMINDVTGLGGDPMMCQVVRDSGAGVIAMHMQGTPQTMQDHPSYENVVDEVYSYLANRKQWLVDQGIENSKICLDPGIGFGKTHQHNLQLLHGVSAFRRLGCPLLIGHSRKGFIRKITGDDQREQIPGTLAVSLYLATQGVDIVRVHDVRLTRQAWAMQEAIEYCRIDANP